MKLHYKKSGQGKPIIILHGLLGMLDNWQTIGKVLSETNTVFLADARNHGHSPHSDIFNYDVMADDINEFMEDEKIDEAILMGHSMGGKTVMKFAQKYPEKVEKFIVVDIAPKYYPVHHDAIFEALLAVNFTFVKSRKDAEEILAKYITENYVRQFLLKNLYWLPHPQPLSNGEGSESSHNQLAWRFNLETIYKNLENIGEAMDEKTIEKSALFLRSEKSNYILDDDFEMLKKKFPQSEIKTIPNTGHWIHSEQPELFVKAVVEFLTLNSKL